MRCDDEPESKTSTQADCLGRLPSACLAVPWSILVIGYGSGHSSEPNTLLALAQAISGQHSRAWLVAVPARSCEYGADLSHAAKVGVAHALCLFRALLRPQRDVLCMKSD